MITKLFVPAFILDAFNQPSGMDMPCFRFVCFDSLRPINNFSVKQGRVFLISTSTKLGQMCLAQGPQRSDAGEARILGLESSTLPLSHCAPWNGHAATLQGKPRTNKMPEGFNNKYEMRFPVKDLFVASEGHQLTVQQN